MNFDNESQIKNKKLCPNKVDIFINMNFKSKERYNKCSIKRTIGKKLRGSQKMTSLLQRRHW